MRGQLKKNVPRLAEVLTEEILTALGHQGVAADGHEVATTVIPILVGQLAVLSTQQAQVAVQIKALVEARHLHPVSTSMPGIGVRTTARILTEAVGKSFVTAAHPTSYDGIAPVT